MKIKKFNDEREERNKTEALAKGAIVAGVLIVLRLGYLLITGNADFEIVWYDLIILLAIVLTYLISLSRSKTFDVPRTIFGKELPTDMTKEAKNKRILKHYIPTTIAFLIAYRIGSYFAVGLSEWFAEIILLIIQAAIFFPLNYFWGERRLKQYNRGLED